MTAAEKLLRELIALPSVNPGFSARADADSGEQRVGDFLAACAGSAGMDVEFQPVLPGRSNLLARISPSGTPTQRIVLAPHLDTVGVDSAEAFVPRRQNGRLHGRGACDTKGSVAAMFSAMRTIAAKGPRPKHTELLFAGLVDEEDAQSGSRALVKSGLKAGLAIVGEPTQLRVVTAHKGDIWLQLETRGKAAHGARPELGRNAVLEMSRVVQLLETDYARQLRRRTHPLLGRATISVGSINGGSQPNIVPDRCVISADRRTLPGESERLVRQEIKALLARHRLNAVIANAKKAPCLPMQTDPRLPLVRQFLGHVGTKKTWGVDFFCDASILARGGIPSVVFGPGDIAQAHTRDEWISLRSLDRATAMLTSFLRSLP
jgi:succinyl-diaminopimelate desuccinylase